MSINDQYIENAKDILDKAEKYFSEYNGDCKDCKFYKYEYYTEKCTHPVVFLQSKMTPTAHKHIIDRTDIQRSKSSMYGKVLCGPFGALFQKKEEKKSLYRRFVNFFLHRDD